VRRCILAHAAPSDSPSTRPASRPACFTADDKLGLVLFTLFERGDFDLARIAAPTLVIRATDDSFVPIAHGRHSAGIPNARFAPQEYGGHFVYVRDTVLAEIRRFIARALLPADARADPRLRPVAVDGG
jgi:pimeloyl-ACP methyl ester carboxylesterase